MALTDQRSLSRAAGLGVTDAAPNEARMSSLLAAGDAAGALEVMQSASNVNARMINMCFTAKLSMGAHLDSAAIEMLRSCEQAGLTPTTAMHNNVLSKLSTSGPPEAVLAWLARMHESGIGLDLVACNIKLKALAAMGELRTAVDLLSAMMRGSPSGPPTPDACSFNSVISALANTPGYADKAERLLVTMLDTGFGDAPPHTPNARARGGDRFVLGVV
jgi:hypothetical protein